jgi:phage repressor protein C with HTH and peptisase S24 domain
LLAGKTKNPSREAIAKLAEVFSCDADYLWGEQETPRYEVPNAREPRKDQLGSASIPMYQIGLTDPDGFFSLNESRKTTITSVFAAGPEVYAVSVPDDTMAPRYRSGEVVIVNPYKPVMGGGFAIVRMKDDRVAIREVVSINPETISVKNLSSQAIVELARETVKTLHRIVGSCELT